MKHAQNVTTLILPGIGNSGPEHWQSQWERRDATFIRVAQNEWDAPRRADWVAVLDSAIMSQKNHVVLVSHSSACALVAHWITATPAAHHARVRGALLVAPSDPEGPSYPVGPSGFAPVPMVALPFRSIVVSSDDDVYVTEAQARKFAKAWGSEFVLMPGAGHINVASGHGPWHDGFALLQSLTAAG